MCDICIEAYNELEQFVETTLKPKFLGTTLKNPRTGKDEPVSPGHHVFVAAQGLAQKTAAEEIQFELELKAKEEGLTVEALVEKLQRANDGPVFPSGPKASSRLFSGGNKVIDA